MNIRKKWEFWADLGLFLWLILILATNAALLAGFALVGVGAMLYLRYCK